MKIRRARRAARSVHAPTLSALESRLTSAERVATVARAEATVARDESRQARAEAIRARRQVGVTWAVAATGCLFSFVAGASPEARAQFGVTLASLDTRLRSVENSVTTQSARVAAVETKTQFVTVSGNEMYVTGANLHLRNGSGFTDSAVNGRGNLIIGYNEVFNFGDGTRGGDERGGSHNLVIGRGHDYTSYGGLVAGESCRVTAASATVTGGAYNQATNNHAHVSGGYGNIASGQIASVSGGYGNVASGQIASVSGGRDNVASGDYTSVSGGRNNVASGEYASVLGGNNNRALGEVSTISGGANGLINVSGVYASLSGGNGRTVSTSFGWAAGSGGSAFTGNFSTP